MQVSGSRTAGLVAAGRGAPRWVAARRGPAVLLALAAALALLLSGGLDTADAQDTSRVLVSNIDQAPFLGPDLTDGSPAAAGAQAFTTGANRTGYTLHSIELRLHGGTALPEVTLHEGARDATPVATLTGPDSPPSGGASVSFTPTTSVTLKASTTYWVVAQGGGGRFDKTTSDAEDATPASGWGIDDGADVRQVNQDAFSAETKSFRIRVSGVINPTTAPTIESATVKGTSLVVVFNRRLLAADLLGTSAFTLKKTPEGGSEMALTLTGKPSISGNRLTLTLDSGSAVTATDTDVKLTYTKPSIEEIGNKLADIFGNDVETFIDREVTYDSSPNVLATGKPGINAPNTFRVPSELFINTRGIEDANGSKEFEETATYIWQRFSADGKTLENADIGTARTYTLTNADAGKTIRVQVSFVDDEGYTEMLEISDPTVVITAAETCAAPDDAGGAVRIWTESARIFRLIINDDGFNLEVSRVAFTGSIQDVLSFADLSIGQPLNIGADYRVSGVSEDTTLTDSSLTSRKFVLQLQGDSALPVSVRRHLAIYVCDAPLFFRHADYEFRAGLPGLSEDAHVYSWGNPSFDWSTQVEQMLYIIRDEVGPTAESARVSGTSLVITFNEDLGAADSLSNSAFTVKKTPEGGSETTLTLTGAPSISGRTVTLTLDPASAVTATDTDVKVTYTRPTTGMDNRIIDRFTNEADTFTKDVPDLDPPTVESATVDGTSLVVTFNENLAAAASLSNDAFTVKKTPSGGSETTLTLTGTPSISGKTVTLTLDPDSAVTAADSDVKVTYTRPTTGTDNRVADNFGNAVDTFTDQMVVNRTAPVVESITVSGKSLVITFNAELGAAPSLANDAFTAKKTPSGESETTLTLTGTPSISGRTVTLTVDSAVAATDTDFKVSYEKPTTGTDNRLIGSTGIEVDSFTDQEVFIQRPQDACTVTVTDAAGVITIPDANLRAAVEKALIMSSGDAITLADMAKISGLDAQNMGILSTEGLQYATNIWHLNLRDNRLSSAVGICWPPSPTHVYLSGNDLSTIDLGDLSKVRHVLLDSNRLTEITGIPTHLYSLSAVGNRLTSFAMPGDMPNLLMLNLRDNLLTSVTFHKANRLLRLQLSSNRLASIDLTPLFVGATPTETEFRTQIWIAENSLTDVTVPGSPKIGTLFLHGNDLTSLTLPEMNSATYIELMQNKLTSVDIAGMPKLEYLGLSYNELPSTETSKFNFGSGRNFPELEHLDLSHNRLEGIEFHADQFPKMRELRINSNGLATIHLANLGTSLQCVIAISQRSDVANPGSAFLTSVTVDGAASNANIYGPGVAMPETLPAAGPRIYTGDEYPENDIELCGALALGSQENHEPVGFPDLTGSAVTGQTLTATTSDITDANGMTGAVFTYQWWRVDSRVSGAEAEKILGATGQSYLVTFEDEHHAIWVVVTYTDDAGFTHSVPGNRRIASVPINVGGFGIFGFGLEGNGPPGNEPEDPVVDWKASLTVGNMKPGIDETERGWRREYCVQTREGASDIEDHHDGDTCYGRLTDRDFVLDGNTYTLEGIYHTVGQRDESLTITFDDEVDLAPLLDLVFIVDGETYAVADRVSTSGSRSYRIDWYASPELNASGGWQLGSTIEVELKAAPAEEEGEESSDEAGEESSVEPTNREPTGEPTIDGTTEAGDVLTADTSAIADADGLTNAVFTYQWKRIDPNSNDTEGEDIPAATGQTYALTSQDVGKSLRVVVTYTDDGGFTQSLPSPLTDAVTAEPTDRPYGLQAVEQDGTVVLTWEAPDITRDGADDYRILRHRPELGESEPLVHVDFTGTSATSYTDTTVQPGVLYVYRVKAVVNFFGDLGEASKPISIRMSGEAAVQQQETITPALSLSDFDAGAGQRVLAKAHIKTGNEGRKNDGNQDRAWYATDTGDWHASGELLEGSLAWDDTTLTRVVYFAGTGIFRFNDARDAFDLGDSFEAGGDNHDLTIWIQTEDGKVSFKAKDHIVNHGGHWINFRAPQEIRATLDAIAEGDEIIVAVSLPADP